MTKNTLPYTSRPGVAGHTLLRRSLLLLSSSNHRLDARIQSSVMYYNAPRTNARPPATRGKAPLASAGPSDRSVMAFRASSGRSAGSGRASSADAKPSDSFLNTLFISH